MPAHHDYTAVPPLGEGGGLQKGSRVGCPSRHRPSRDYAGGGTISTPYRGAVSIIFPISSSVGGRVDSPAPRVRPISVNIPSNPPGKAIADVQGVREGEIVAVGERRRVHGRGGAAESA